MNKYRSHHCGELNIVNVGENIILSGWINKKRDHGNLLFIDLRDHYGITQCVIDKKNKQFSDLESISLESVIRINGVVIQRSKDTVNKNLPTGEIEIKINSPIRHLPPLLQYSLKLNKTLKIKIPIKFTLFNFFNIFNIFFFIISFFINLFIY